MSASDHALRALAHWHILWTQRWVMKICAALAAMLVASACSSGSGGSDSDNGKSDTEQMEFERIGPAVPGERIEMVSENGEDLGVIVEVPGHTKGVITLIPATPNGNEVSLHITDGEAESFDDTTEFLWSSSKDQVQFTTPEEDFVMSYSLLIKAPEGKKSRVLIDAFWETRLWLEQEFKELAEAEPNDDAGNCQEITETLHRFARFKLRANLGKGDVDCYVFENRSNRVRIQLDDGGANHELTLCEPGHLDDCLDAGPTHAHYLPIHAKAGEKRYVVFVRSKTGESGDYTIDMRGIDDISD
jgi:hypothetical protein